MAASNAESKAQAKTNTEVQSKAEAKADSTEMLVASARVYANLVHKAVAAQRETVAALALTTSSASAEAIAAAAERLALAEKAGTSEAAKATINYSSWPDCMTASARLRNGTVVQPPANILTQCQNCMNYVCNYDPSIPFYDQSCPPQGRSLLTIPAETSSE